MMVGVHILLTIYCIISLWFILALMYVLPSLELQAFKKLSRCVKMHNQTLNLKSKHFWFHQLFNKLIVLRSSVASNKKEYLLEWRLRRPITNNQSLDEVGRTVGTSVDFFPPQKEKMAPSSKSEKEDNGNKQKQQRKHKDHIVKLLTRGKVLKRFIFSSCKLSLFNGEGFKRWNQMLLMGYTCSKDIREAKPSERFGSKLHTYRTCSALPRV